MESATSVKMQAYQHAFVELANSENEYLERLRFYQQEFIKLSEVKPSIVLDKKRLTEKIFWAYFKCKDLIPYTEYLAHELALTKKRIESGEDARLFDMDWKLDRMKQYNSIVVRDEACEEELKIELEENDMFEAYGKVIEEAHFERFGKKVSGAYNDALKLPSIHIMRYALPLEEMLKLLPDDHPDKPPCQELLRAIKGVVSGANDFQNHMKTAEEMLRLRTTILGLKKDDERRLLTMANPLIAQLRCKAYFKDHIVEDIKQLSEAPEV